MLIFLYAKCGEGSGYFYCQVHKLMLKVYNKIKKYWYGIIGYTKNKNSLKENDSFMPMILYTRKRTKNCYL